MGKLNLPAAGAAALPKPRAVDPRPPRDRASLEVQIADTVAEWHAVLPRLERAAAWFKAHDGLDDGWAAAVRLRGQLIGDAYRCRLTLEALLPLLAEFAGTDYRADWLIVAPDADTMARLTGWAPRCWLPWQWWYGVDNDDE